MSKAASQLPMTIKLRVSGSDFPAEAYDAIDRHLATIAPTGRPFELERHESGPEILAVLSAVDVGTVTQTLQFAKVVLELVVIVIKARADAIMRGSRPSSPDTLVIRRRNGVIEEIAFSINPGEHVDQRMVADGLAKAALKLLATDRRPEGG